MPQSYCSACLAAVLACVLCGCASEPTVLPPTAHAPTTINQVKIYQQAPKQYEVLSRIEVPVAGEVRWDASGNSAAGFAQMKAKAAASGANGILLQAPASEHQMVVTVGDGKQYYQVPLQQNPRTALAQAIYVREE